MDTHFQKYWNRIQTVPRTLTTPAPPAHTPMNCFAYGSNMNREQMKFRCPGARPIARGYIDHWEFVINQRGVATIQRQDGARVYGVVWRLTNACERALDVCEGVEAGFYGKFKLDITTIRTGVRRPCLTYIDPLGSYGSPRPGYLEKILIGASAAKLPKSYVTELLEWR